jgi:integrase
VVGRGASPAYAGDSDLVFGHPALGPAIAPRRSSVKAALVAAEAREVRFHDLRHAFGTRMAAAGCAVRTLQEWLGRGDFTTTLIYADYQPGEREADLVDDAFQRSPVCA